MVQQLLFLPYYYNFFVLHNYAVSCAQTWATPCWHLFLHATVVIVATGIVDGDGATFNLRTTVNCQLLRHQAQWQQQKQTNKNNNNKHGCNNQHNSNRLPTTQPPRAIATTKQALPLLLLLQFLLLLLLLLLRLLIPQLADNISY